MKRVRLFIAILFFAMIAPSRLKSEPATRAAQLDPVRIHCGAHKPRFGISGEKVALAYSWGATGSAANRRVLLLTASRRGRLSCAVATTDATRHR